MRKKTTKTTETNNNTNNNTNNTYDIYNNDNNNHIYNDNISNDNNSDNVINDINDNNVNNVLDDDKNKKGFNIIKNQTHPRTQKAIDERKQLWDDVENYKKDIVIKCILENMPTLNMSPPRIVQYLRLLYTSNQKTIEALEKLQENKPLSSSDIVNTDDTVEVNAAYYPKIIETIEIDQILTDKQSRFLNNVRNGMDKKSAFLEAGYSEGQLFIMSAITQPDIDKLNPLQLKTYKKVWYEYWKIKKEQSEATGITEDYILSGFKKQVDFNVKKLFDNNGNFKNINDLDDETAKQITEIKISEAKKTNNKTRETTTRTTTLSIKIGNKDLARKELSKLQAGIFAHTRDKTINHNHNVSGSINHGVLDVNKLSQDQLDKILMIGQKDQLILDNQAYNSDIIDGDFQEI